MARRPRLDLDGFHHIINRGVARSSIYECDADKEVFLKILCKACRIYKVNVHDYCLMDNHYHLLIETTAQNLSLFMRQVNGNYAIYFNKKYKRTGHLWQGRYKSWYIVNETYLYTLFRYIEHNPLEAGITTSVGEYPFTLLGAVLDKQREVAPCAQHSKLIKEYRYKAIQALLDKPLNPHEHKELEDEQKKKIVQVEHAFRQMKEKKIEAHFEEVSDLPSRNAAILEALNDGYTQGEVARYLGVTAALVSHVFRNQNDL